MNINDRNLFMIYLEAGITNNYIDNTAVFGETNLLLMSFYITHKIFETENKLEVSHEKKREERETSSVENIKRKH